MNIAVIGTGYVGLVAGVCLADMGNDVICVDIDEKKVKTLNDGGVPIYEPGLEDMLRRNHAQGRIRFTTDIAQAIKQSLAIFIAVGTPPGKNHEADLSAVMAVAQSIGQHMDGYRVVVDKSTVPVGTAEKVKAAILKSQTTPHPVDVVSNPEFLREGEAIRDFTIPDRIVVGTDSERARTVMEKLYKGIARTDHPLLFTDIKSAEMIKYASNAMLATRISFMNEVARLCEQVGADVKAVAKGMGLDDRIGPRFLQAGCGYGGSCFPKDVNAFRESMKEHGLRGSILDAVEQVNAEQKRSLLPKLKKHLPDLKGKTVALWGLSFKPKTDDMREAPSLVIIDQLQNEGATVVAYDPEAMQAAAKLVSDVRFAEGPYEAIDRADALIVVTEWNVFRDLDKEKVKQLLKQPIVIDGRNVYEVAEMKEAGFAYESVGRSV